MMLQIPEKMKFASARKICMNFSYSTGKEKHLLHSGKCRKTQMLHENKNTSQKK